LRAADHPTWGRHFTAVLSRRTTLTALRNTFSTAAAHAAFVSAFDFNGDGVINGTDLAQFRSRFGVILP